MKVGFEDINLRGESLKIINQANQIIAAYQAAGYRLTLRQLYYQFVARDLLKNTQQNYKRLGNIVANGRLAGLIDWGGIEDRTRNLAGVTHWEDPAQIMEGAASSFRLDKWEDQPNRVEVWIEKEALVGVIERTCRALDVDYFACRGYVSLSELFDAGYGRMRSYMKKGQKVTVLHLGDHDPSGLDMTRNLDERLNQFADGLGLVDVNRIALNWDQIQLYNPPPNPAKETDSRYEGYVDQYGYESWELDALDPVVLNELIEAAVLDLRDSNLWNGAVADENEMRRNLSLAAKHWDDVADYITETFDNGSSAIMGK